MYKQKNLMRYTEDYIFYYGNADDVISANGAIPFANKKRDYLDEFDGQIFRPKRNGVFHFRGYTYWTVPNFYRIGLLVTRNGVNKTYDMNVSSQIYNIFELSFELFIGDMAKVFSLTGGTLSNDTSKHFLTIAKRF